MSEAPKKIYIVGDTSTEGMRYCSDESYSPGDIEYIRADIVEDFITKARKTGVTIHDDDGVYISIPFKVFELLNSKPWDK